ncbi:MAG: NAD(P)H-binding protein [Streptomyces sp.]|nr:NAD(P)H-binding protein [Streptomyces sp.]
MDVLVIGATGKTGRPVVEALAARGTKVRAASRTPRPAAAAGVEPVRFDWAERGTWRPALDGAGAMYVVGPVWQPEPELLMHQLLADAREAGTRRVVLLSVMGADRLPSLVPMAGWERDVRVSGLEWTVLRPNWFQQNFGQGFAPGLRERGTLELPVGAATAVSFVDTGDIAEVAALALTEDGHAGRVYDLTGPEAVTHGEALAALGRAAGRELRYVPLDADGFAAGLRERGVPERAAQWQLALFRLMDAGGNTAVTSTVADVTGRPARPLAAYAGQAAAALA